MANLLDYENRIFLDCFEDDGLLITAKGLGIERLILGFLHVYSDPSSLVFVINTNTNEENFFLEQLQSREVSCLPKVITAEYSSSERHSIYLQGGVLFVTSRILIADFLTTTVPASHLAGILVYRAHKIVESCQESFVLRLFRQQNKTGFIKAFSDSPVSFTRYGCSVERVMKACFVRRLYLWPRFHADVISCFDQHKVDVVELQFPMSPLALTCQAAIMDLVNACVKELRRCSSLLECDDISVENAITRSFDKLVKQLIDPHLYRLGSKVMQLLSDIGNLRRFLQYLTQYDCVTFLNLLNITRGNERNFGKTAGWMFLDEADSLFVNAKLRVVGGDKHKDEQSKANKGSQIEVPPKWRVLSEILTEIKEEAIDSYVLIVASDERNCSQITDYLRQGSDVVLTKLYKKYIESSTAQPKEKKKKDESKSSSCEVPYGILSCPVCIIQPLYSSSDKCGLIKTLYELRPRHVILYDVDLKVVRQLEVYRASHPGVPLRVYFLMYSSSVEEQIYLTEVSREKDAFSMLIKEKTTMVLPTDVEGRSDANPDKECVTALPKMSSMRAGGDLEDAQVLDQQKILVDMREFRSELPSLIHKRGIDIEPLTLEVGDYILTPDMCVERKSVSDLIGSLANGRLYNQCVSMCRCYKRPILLIEFDANKCFSFQSRSLMSAEISVNDIVSKLALVTIHFPRLRILWCPSPSVTAELFEELKKGHQQPNESVAMSMTSLESNEMSDKFNIVPQDILSKMPGINSKNIYRILNNVRDITELCSLSEEKLKNLLENSENARSLWNFLHKLNSPFDQDHSNVLPLKQQKSSVSIKLKKRRR